MRKLVIISAVLFTAATATAVCGDSGADTGTKHDSTMGRGTDTDLPNTIDRGTLGAPNRAGDAPQTDPSMRNDPDRDANPTGRDPGPAGDGYNQPGTGGPGAGPGTMR